VKGKPKKEHRNRPGVNRAFISHMGVGKLDFPYSRKERSRSRKSVSPEDKKKNCFMNIKKCIQNVGGENLKERDHLEDLRVDGGIILKQICKK
jgi:hypothetical protein